jgi:hypothetical protein
MRVKAGLLAGLAVVLAVPVLAQAGQGDKATGGGQILVGVRGAGDTIAFTAQEKGGNARGNVTYQDREGGTGQRHTTHHGRVFCIDAVGNVARIAGTWRDGGTFGLYVEDNGEPNRGADVVTLIDNVSDCSFDEPEDEDKTGLARGNAQVRDGGAATGSRPSKPLTYSKALRLAGLR